MFKESLPDDSYITLVTGDREWTNIDVMVTALTPLPSSTVIVHGYATGADTIADIVGRELGFRVVRCPAHWRHHETKCVEVWGRCPEDCQEVVGRPAGQIRNQVMYNTYQPNIVFGFHNNITISKGTKGMLKYAQRRGTDSVLFTEHSSPEWNLPLTTASQSRKIPKSSADTFFSF